MSRPLVAAVTTCVTLGVGAVAVASDVATEPSARPECPLVARVAIEDPAELALLASRFDVWEVDHAVGVAVLGVTPAELALLRDAGSRVTVDAERTRGLCEAIRARPKTAASGIPGFECYRTVAETHAAAAALAAAHPLLVELRDIGDSWEKLAGRGGHDLLLLRITNRETPGAGAPDGSPGKPVLFLEASLHAREYTPVETATRFAELLVAGYGRDPDVTWMLDQQEVQVLLTANPDGRIRAEEGLLWRKNADDDFCTGSNRRGIDLNRNFEHDWGCCNGSSGNQCSELFRGPTPGSEPETGAIQDHLRRVFGASWAPVPAVDTPGLFLDLHSYGRLVLWPWGATREVAPNGAALARLGERLAELARSTPMQGVDFYAVDGSAMDFAYADRGIAAFTIEIGYEFFEPCPIYEGALVDGILDTLLYAARVAGAPYLWPAAPDIGELTLTPSGPFYPGDVLVLAGRAHRRPVAAVEVTIDVPPWAAAAAERIIAAPADGVFDSAAEAFTATIPTAGLAGGRHLVFARAQAADGTWGAPWAIFVDVVDVTPRHPTARVGH